MTDQQKIEVGQIWRRKKNGRLIRIARPHRYTFDPTGQFYDDWEWEGHDYKGSGVSYGDYIRRDCELVESSVSSEVDS